MEGRIDLVSNLGAVNMQAQGSIFCLPTDPPARNTFYNKWTFRTFLGTGGNGCGLWFPTPSLFFPMAQQPIVGQGLVIDASRSPSDTPHSVGLLWTSDQPDADTPTWQHTTLTRDRRPCLQRDSNPQFRQPSGRRPTPSTARPLGSPHSLPHQEHFIKWSICLNDRAACSVRALLYLYMLLVPQFAFVSDALTPSVEGLRMVNMRNAYRVLGLEPLREKHLEDLGAREIIILKGCGIGGSLTSWATVSFSRILLQGIG